MTWKSFQADAFALTQDDIKNLNPYIIDQYRSAIKAINTDLKSVYAEILSGVKPEDYYNTMLKYDRLTKLLDSVTKQYSIFSRAVGKAVGQAGEISMSNTFYRLQYSHKWLVSGIDFALLPNELVQMSVYGSIEAYKKYQAGLKLFGAGANYMPQYGTLSNLLATNRSKEIAAINRTITQGLLRGESYTKTSKALSNIIGQIVKKDGVANFTGALANSTRIVRTESTRIMNEASAINTEYARSQGVEVVRFWNASLDSRTRPKHGRLDDKPEDKNGMWLGNVSGPGQFPNVGDNVNCRCTTFESINGSKPTVRRGINPQIYDVELKKNLANDIPLKKAEAKAKATAVEVFEYTDFSSWAKENGLKTNKFGKIL